MIPEPTMPKKAVVAVHLDEQALARLRELDPDGRQGVVMRVLAAFETSLARMQRSITILGRNRPS